MSHKVRATDDGRRTRLDEVFETARCVKRHRALGGVSGASANAVSVCPAGMSSDIWLARGAR
jgi:hypothetical protein